MDFVGVRRPIALTGVRRGGALTGVHRGTRAPDDEPVAAEVDEENPSTQDEE